MDVRLNGGGDNTTYGALLTAFQSKAVNRPGRLYLLIGRATFSAAGNFSAELERSTRAIVVGEPTGGGVETYGDTVPVLLVEPGWLVHIAGRYHERKRGPGDRRLAVEPDVRIEQTSAQYFAGRDPVLERALNGSLDGHGTPHGRRRGAMVVDQLERVAEDEPPHVVGLEELAREAEPEPRRLREPLHVLVLELDVERGEVLAQLGLRARADDRHELPRLGADPGDGDLGRGHAQLVGDRDDLLRRAPSSSDRCSRSGAHRSSRSGTSP